jgi:hypothetical protein
MRHAGHVVCMGDRVSVHRVLRGRPEGMRASGKSGCILDDNIKMDLPELR